MNDYQQLKDRNYVLPQTVYRQALYAVKDLDRLRKKLDYLRGEAYGLQGRDLTDIVGQTGYVSDRMADKAVEIASTEARIISSRACSLLFSPHFIREYGVLSFTYHLGFSAYSVRPANFLPVSSSLDMRFFSAVQS